MNIKKRTRGGFLIRRSSAIRRYIAGFLKCDSRTIMKSFLNNIARELTGNLHKNPPEISWELRLMGNPPHKFAIS